MTWQPMETHTGHYPRWIYHPVYGQGCAFCAVTGEWFWMNQKPLVTPPTHWMPLPTPPEPDSDVSAFLSTMLAAAETGTPVTADDVARLRRMADWADAPPPDGWNGTLDKHETRRAVEAARLALP